MLCRKRIDTWKATFQPGVAVAMGFGENGAGALMESFFKTVRTVKYFAMLFLEKRYPSHGLWGSLRSSMSATKVTPGVVVLDGILFCKEKTCPRSLPKRCGW